MENTTETTTPATAKVKNAKAKIKAGAKPKTAKAKAPKTAKAPKAKKAPAERKQIPNGTGDTMKFQANGPTSWKKEFAAIAKSAGSKTLGAAVHGALEYGLAHASAVIAQMEKAAKAAAKAAK